MRIMQNITEVSIICTLEEFADMFSARYHEQIINNSELKIFLRREAERKNKDK